MGYSDSLGLYRQGPYQGFIAVFSDDYYPLAGGGPY